MVPIVDRMKKNRLIWFGQVIRGGSSKAMRVAIKINIEGKRGKG